MQVLQVRNVSEALPRGVDLLRTFGQRRPSRAGDVLVATSPVVTVYSAPTERVLFSRVRDANPFFHLAEAMWVLAGRDDTDWLNRFVHDFGQRFADDGVIHGAYGHRIRKSLGFDQLNAVVERLLANLDDRQCVLQIWDAVRGGPNDLLGSWKDRPCNTHVYLRARPASDGAVLDLTVCCRSNDIIWGAYGANAVVFSFLQEYIAARCGFRVGTLYQMSNNYHAYVDELDRMAARTPPAATLSDALMDQRYPGWTRTKLPLMDQPLYFDAEVCDVIESVEAGGHNWMGARNRFLNDVWAALAAYGCRKSEPYQCDVLLSSMQSDDWRVACQEWVARRRAKAVAA